MTRGKIVYISNDMILCSTEFNGDMYYSGYGAEVIEKLRGCEDVAGFHQLVADFNADHHHYNDVLLMRGLWSEWTAAEDKSTTFSDALNYWMDFSTNYIDNWFSDYLYIKNGSNIPVPIKTAEFETSLEPGEITSLCFGCVAKDWKENPLLPPIPSIEEIANSVDWACVQCGDEYEFNITSPEYIDFSFCISDGTPEQLYDRVYRSLDMDWNEFYLSCIRDGAFQGYLTDAVDDRDWLAAAAEELCDAVRDWLHENFVD